MVMYIFLGFLQLTLFLQTRGLPDEHGMEATPHFLTNLVIQETRFHSLYLLIYLPIYLSIYLLPIYLGSTGCVARTSPAATLTGLAPTTLTTLTPSTPTRER